jgi:hypothetical protein
MDGSNYPEHEVIQVRKLSNKLALKFLAAKVKTRKFLLLEKSSIPLTGLETPHTGPSVL